MVTLYIHTDQAVYNTLAVITDVVFPCGTIACKLSTQSFFFTDGNSITASSCLCICRCLKRVLSLLHELSSTAVP